MISPYDIFLIVVGAITDMFRYSCFIDFVVGWQAVCAACDEGRHGEEDK